MRIPDRHSNRTVRRSTPAITAYSLGCAASRANGSALYPSFQELPRTIAGESATVRRSDSPHQNHPQFTALCCEPCSPVFDLTGALEARIHSESSRHRAQPDWPADDIIRRRNAHDDKSLRGGKCCLESTAPD